MIYFWSDTHFNHASIIEHCNRPYPDAVTMNEVLIQRWNDAVTSKDIVYHLGDFGFRPRRIDGVTHGHELIDVFNRLNGHKHLILGNHDESKRNTEVPMLPWLSTQRMLRLKAEKHTMILCHFALETWDGMHRGYLMLHGHSHGTLKRQVSRRFDVGCDVWHHPVALDTLLAIGRTQSFIPQDHHGDEL